MLKSRPGHRPKRPPSQARSQQAELRPMSTTKLRLKFKSTYSQVKINFQVKTDSQVKTDYQVKTDSQVKANSQVKTDY